MFGLTASVSYDYSGTLKFPYAEDLPIYDVRTYVRMHYNGAYSNIAAYSRRNFA